MKKTHGLTSSKCCHVKSDGSHCGASARHGSVYCFFHDPDSAPERETARKRGGIERSRRAAVLPAGTPDCILGTSSDVVALLTETINQVRRGEVDPRTSNAVGYLAGILLKAKEKDETEQRLARLESIISGQKAHLTSDTEADGSPEALEFVNPDPGGQA